MRGGHKESFGGYGAPGPTVATALVTKDGSTVRYASIFAKKYGTRICNGTGTVRWYGTLQKLN